MKKEKKSTLHDVMDIAKTLRTETGDVLGSYTGTSDGPNIRPEQDGDDI